MARNTLAGTKTGKSKSARRYQNDPKARAKKKAYDKAYHATPERKKYRSELNKENRKRGTAGNKDGKDVSHKKRGGTTLESQSKNRARNGSGGKSSKK